MVPVVIGRWRALRVRPVLQMEAAECGVACLTMVLAHYGHHAALAEVRETCGTSRDGNSVLDLLNAARRFGLEGRGRSIRLSALKRLRRPAILHWEMNHFVVLEGVDQRGVSIIDPASGRRRVDLAQVNRAFSGVVLELVPSATFQRRRKRSLSYERYRSALSAAGGSLPFLLLANLAAQLLALTQPAATQILIDHVIVPHRHDWLLPVLAVVFFGIIGRVLLIKLQGAAQALLQARLGLELTLGLGLRLLRLPLRFLEGRAHGDLLGRVRAQAELQGLVAHAAQALFEPLSLALLVGLMLAYDLQLGSLVLALMVVRVLVLRRARGAIEQRVAAELAAQGSEQSTLVEATTGPELTKGLRLEARLLARHERRVLDRVSLGIRAERLRKGLASSLAVLDGLTEAAILFYGGSRVIAGAMTIGVFAGFLTIRAMLQAPLTSLLGLFESWLRFRGALERSDEILAVEPVRSGPLEVAGVTGRLEVRNLCFRYGSGGAWVLRNVNLTIEPGEHVVVLGPSGHGKSTLGKLLCGLLEPCEGEILLDGVPLREYSRASLARCFGVVLQEPLILQGSVREALALRVPEASPQLLRTAARAARFEEVIARSREGYDTPLLALGVNLSGGERQRLALAQALVGGPPVLLLDEVTSALDAETESRVLAELDALPSTIVSVAHRREVIERAARAFHVEGGVVQELIQAAPDSGVYRARMPAHGSGSSLQPVYES